ELNQDNVRISANPRMELGCPQEIESFRVGMIDAEVARHDRVEAAKAREIESRRLLPHRFEEILHRIQCQFADEGVGGEEGIAPAERIARELSVDAREKTDRQSYTRRSPSAIGV